MYAWYTLTGSSDACASTLTALRAAAASVASLKDTILLHEIQYIGIGSEVCQWIGSLTGGKREDATRQLK